MMFAVALIVGAAAIIGVGVWSSRSEYVLLANQLGPSQAAELISRLQAAGIDYELNLTSSEVKVPKQAYGLARNAAGELLEPLSDESFGAEGGIFEDPMVIKQKQQRQHELQIARMIMRLNGIAQADVRISRPDPSPFIRSAKATTASVVLTFKPGLMFDRQQAASVVSIVSHAVEGLRPDDITVVDTTGRILSEKQFGPESEVSAQFEFQQRMETDLAAKAETMLSQILGPGHAIVRVTADVDFTQTTRVEDTYDPDAKVKKTEKITTEDTTNREDSVGGAGAAQNTQAAPAASTATRGSQSSKSETIDTTYENSKTTNTVKVAPGRLQRLTVSAAVDIPKPAEGTTALVKEDIERIIKQAVGFSEARQDAIEVVVGQLAGVPLLDAPVSPWKQYEGLVRNASLGVASLVVLAISLLTLKKMRPVVVAPPAGDGLSFDSSRRLSTIARQVEDDPQAIAQLLETWLGEDEKQKQGSVRAAA
jgi:flagellar M-ring protein FliF